MNRKQFIRNIFLATGIYLLPKCLRPEDMNAIKETGKEVSSGIYPNPENFYRVGDVVITNNGVSGCVVASYSFDKKIRVMPLYRNSKMGDVILSRECSSLFEKKPSI